MSKLDQAIFEIHYISNKANEDQWLNRIHPLVKFIVTIGYISCVVSFSKYHVAGLAGMLIYPLILFIAGDVSFRDSLHRLRLVLPLVCMIGLLNPFFDKATLLTIYGVPISGGIISMLTLIWKGILTVLASYLFIITTSIEKICYAMRVLHLPQSFVTQILLIYRYVTVLLEEANTIVQAYRLRAPNQKGIAYKSWGSLIGQLLLRSVDRAEEIYTSMCLRGYQGSFPSSSEIKGKAKDYQYLVLWLLVFILLRFTSVLEIIGNLVVG